MQSPIRPMMNTSLSDPGYMTLPFRMRFENALKEPNILVKCKLLTDLIFESISTNIKDMQNRFVLLIEDIFSFNNQNILSYANNNINNNNNNTWPLKTLTKDMAPNEFDAIYYFLCVEGPLFKLINYLINNNNEQIRYEYSLKQLPSSLLNNIENGSYFFDKISPSTTTLYLNAFEFFLIHFSCYITRDTINISSNQFYVNNNNNNNEDTLNVLYYILLENYLECFLPIMNTNPLLKSSTLINGTNLQPSLIQSSPNEKSSIWKSLSSTTTNLLNLSSSLSNNQQQQQQLYQQQQSPMNIFGSRNVSFNNYNNNNNNRMNSSILNQKIFNQFQQQQQQQYFNDYQNDSFIIKKCEIVLRIFSEIWLANPYKKFININNEQPINNNINILNRLSIGQFNITIEHMRVVRIFIKHLHFFSNNNNNNQFNNYQNNNNNNDLFDNLKRSIWTEKFLIQKNLYTFLRIVFDRWPNDSSFRIPLETWLSYIQPWRYLSPSFNNLNNINSNSNRMNDILIHNENYWQNFTNNNIIFYTTLFIQIIERILLKLDLSSANNSLLLYRIFKVFGQNNLKNMLIEAETKFLNFNQTTTNNNNQRLSPKQTSPTSRLLMSPYNNKFNPTTSSTTTIMMMNDNQLFHMEYMTIFSIEFRKKIIELLMKIAYSIQKVNESKNKLKEKSSVTSQNDNNDKQSNNKMEILFKSIINFFTIDNSLMNQQLNMQTNKMMITNYDKILNQLNTSIDFISILFSIPQQSIDTILLNAQKKCINENENNETEMNNDNLNNINNNNIYETDENGIKKLTKYGIQQIMNGSLKLDYQHNNDNIVEGNPDTQPIRSYEIKFLVYLTLFISNIINKKFGKIFENYYYKKNNIYGLILRRLLLTSPISYIVYDKQFINNNNDNERNKYKIIMRIEKLPPRLMLRFMSTYKFIIQICLFLLFYLFAKYINYLYSYLIITFIIILISILI